MSAAPALPRPATPVAAADALVRHTPVETSHLDNAPLARVLVSPRRRARARLRRLVREAPGADGHTGTGSGTRSASGLGVGSGHASGLHGAIDAGLGGRRQVEVSGRTAMAGSVVAVATGVAVLGAPLTVALSAGALAGGVWWRSHRRRVGAQARQALLPEALERLASALRSGSSLPQALAEAGRGSPPPLGPELAELARATHRGRPLLDVLDGWTAAHDDRGTRLAATALALAAHVGAAPARAVDGVAATLRERLEVAAERRALATQARASAVVLSVAPVGFALLLGLTDGAAARFLLRTPQGWACLVVGLGLDLLGAVWMARLTQADDPR